MRGGEESIYFQANPCKIIGNQLDLHAHLGNPLENQWKPMKSKGMSENCVKFLHIADYGKTIFLHIFWKIKKK